MAGLLVLSVIVGYFFLGKWLVGRAKSWPIKLLVLVGLILFPTADEIYYRIKLKRFCENEAGFKVYSTASKLAGLLNDEVVYPDYLKLVNVNFVESRNISANKITRLSRTEKGAIESTTVPTISAKYQLSTKKIDTGKFLEYEVFISDRTTKIKLSSLKNLNYYGGWFTFNVLGSIGGSGPTLQGSCGYSETGIDSYKLINSTFTK
ncbi:hypothetical protein [Parvibium lacunae]|uniref:Uncharacterized protein n=1 Tax=Parvibium lacunae TaxID=1888893 RepID=A0A368KZH8_9BURK|nr:hypothetical protein [Parvibium lacunae]RCS56720.1 hypothetical protein DU000_10235 [Parvibium lacunae]